MDFLRNKEVRLQIMLCIGVTVIGSVLSYFFCMKFYWVTFLTGCAITAISLIFTYRRYMKISSLSQDIDRLLHGEESIRFDDYGEGELAVSAIGTAAKRQKVFSGFFGGYFPPIKDTADFS